MRNPYYIVVDYDDELRGGIFDTIEEAKAEISDAVEGGEDVEGWRLLEARNIPFRIEVIVERVEKTNVDTDL